jgi:hypothetical protein
VIIKSSQRSGAGELAIHLTKAVDIDGHSQTVHITSSRYVLHEEDVSASLKDMELMSKVAPRCQKHLYHISVSPEQPMSAPEWNRLWDAYETEFGLQNLAYIEVTHDHLAHDRPPHKHRVYERVDTTEEKAVQLSYTKIRNEKIARRMEHEFGHKLTVGKHNRTVMRHLQQEGFEEVVRWMESGHAHDVKRPIAQKNPNDHQQEKRTQITIGQVQEDLQTAWRESDSGRSFQAAIAERGYVLARGDRRDFVIIDAAGGTHSPRRRLGINAKELRERWADLDPNALPSVEQIHQERSHRPPRIDTSNPDALRQLEERKAETDREIARLEAEQAGERTRQRTTEAKNATATFQGVAAEAVVATHSAFIPASDTDKEHDQRRQIEAMQHWQKSAGSERSKPQERAAVWNEAESWGISKTTLEVLKTYSGTKATEERDKRIDAALDAEAVPEPTAASAYRTGLGQRIREKGRRYYRSADRWLTERLAHFGYSRTETRQVLAASSPELMNKPPGERVSYLRRLIDRAYCEAEHAAPEMSEKKTARSAPGQPSTSQDSRPPKDAKPQSPPPSENSSPERSRKPRR